MDNTGLIIAISAAFMLFFALGWGVRMIYGRLRRMHASNTPELNDVTARLHEAEDQRDQVVKYLEHRERELLNKISQTEAELKAAMEGLGTARQEVGVLHQELERLREPR